MELLKMLSANEILAQVLSFFLLLVILRHFAWKKILVFLDQRREKISVEFKNIEETKLQIAAIKADYESRMASIQEKAEGLVQEALQQGRKISEDIRKKAHEEAQDIINDARQQVRYEVSRVKEQLRDEIVAIALDAARNVIQEKLTEDGDRKIVEDFIKEMESVE